VPCLLQELTKLATWSGFWSTLYLHIVSLAMTRDEQFVHAFWQNIGLGVDPTWSSTNEHVQTGWRLIAVNVILSRAFVHLRCANVLIPAPSSGGCAVVSQYLSNGNSLLEGWWPHRKLRGYNHIRIDDRRYNAGYSALQQQRSLSDYQLAAIAWLL